MHSLLIYVPEDLVIFNKDSDQHNFMINDLNMTFNVSYLGDPRVPFSGGIKNSGFGRELSRYIACLSLLTSNQSDSTINWFTVHMCGVSKKLHASLQETSAEVVEYTFG
jgi:hypothetical protein